LPSGDRFGWLWHLSGSQLRPHVAITAVFGVVQRFAVELQLLSIADKHHPTALRAVVVLEHDPEFQPVGLSLLTESIHRVAVGPERKARRFVEFLKGDLVPHGPRSTTKPRPVDAQESPVSWEVRALGDIESRAELFFCGAFIFWKMILHGGDPCVRRVVHPLLLFPHGG